MLSKKTFLIFFALFLCTTLLFSGCNTSNQSEKESLQTVRLNEVVRSMFYAPQYVAINQGFFAEEGIEIDLQTGWGADKSMTALVSNNADIGFMGSEAAIYVLKRGAQEKVTIFSQLTQRDGSFLISRDPIDQFSWNDLKGKTIIGGRRGGIPEMVMEYTLTNNGIIPHESVEIIQNIAFNATTGAFKGGTGDYIQLFEPNVSTLEKENIGHVAASFGKEGGKLAYTVYMATDSYIKENPEIIQKFTNAIYKGQLWCANHTCDEIAESIKEFFPDDNIEIIKTAVNRYKEQDTWAPNPLVQKEAIENLQEVMISGGELDEKISFEDLADNSFAKETLNNK